MYGDELTDGHLSIQLEDDHRLVSPNSSAPPALLRPDADDADDGTSDDGGSSGIPSRRGSTQTAADASASDSVDTDEGALQETIVVTVDRRSPLFVTDVSVRRRPNVERRRKSTFGHRVVWNLDHEAELAQKVKIL